MPPRFSDNIPPHYEPEYIALIEEYYHEKILKALPALKRSFEFSGDASEEDQQAVQGLEERLQEEIDRLEFTANQLRASKPIVKNWEEFISDSNINDIDTSKIVLRSIHLSMKKLHIEIVEKYHETLNRNIEEDASSSVSADLATTIKSCLAALEQRLEELKREAVGLEQEIEKLSDDNLAKDAELSDAEAEKGSDRESSDEESPDEKGHDHKRARRDLSSESLPESVDTKIKENASIAGLVRPVAIKGAERRALQEAVEAAGATLNPGAAVTLPTQGAHKSAFKTSNKRGR